MFGLGKHKLLAVEDDITKHDLYRDAFAEADFEVQVCQTADGDFVEEVVAFGPDIISMDLMIGKEGAVVLRDGFEAIELLKSDQRTRDIPVIVLTHFLTEEKINRALELGAVDFINLQGNEIHSIVRQFKSYVDHPRRYKPLHPAFV